jgi:hypothetical protein
VSVADARRRIGRRTIVAAGVASAATGAAAGTIGWRVWRRRQRATLPWIRSLRTDASIGPRGGIVVVGDSLTFERIDDLVALLRGAGFGPIRADGRPGRRCAVDVAMATSGVRVVADARAAGAAPRLWLVALGQNDTDRLAGADAERAVAAVLDAIGPEPTVWVNLWTVGDPARWSAFNAAIAAAAASRPNVRIADWPAVAADHPEWFVADGLHNTPDGAAARNRFLVESATV